MLTIIDYGVGNLLSIHNMFKRIGVDAAISSDKNDIAKADKLILPGVGHYDYGMQRLRASGLVDVLNEQVLGSKVPILGICLGVQLLTQSSDEGSEPGLGWINGRTVAFDRLRLGKEQKIPHMGWSEVSEYGQSRLFADMYAEPRFYFVHSYHLQLDTEADRLCNAQYGYDFVAGIEQDNILGVQFHPEKSHKYGMKLLENFVKHY